MGCVVSQGMQSTSDVVVFVYWSFGVLLCTVRSYQTGTCFGGAVLCSGVFHDEYSDGSTASGIWLTIRTSSGQSGSYQALDTWWYGTAADLDLSKLGDSTYQGEDEQVLSGLSGDCSANADVGVAASTGAFSVWSGVFGDSLEVRLFMSLGVCCWVSSTDVCWSE